MSVNTSPDGRRYVEAEVEVQGTPEKVWHAIATGVGISSWFVPTEVENEDDKPKRVTSDFGPGMLSVSTITQWDPPRKFTKDSQDLGPDAPSIATEWIVESRPGGKCVVRVVHSLFTDKADWDDQLEAWEGGWPDFFRLLKLYLGHFRGQPGASFQVSANGGPNKDSAWTTLLTRLGIGTLGSGEQAQSVEPAPRLRAVLEKTKHPDERVLRLEEPAPGFAHVFCMPMEQQNMFWLRFYLFGDRADEVESKEKPLWEAWLHDIFPETTPVGR